MYKTIFSIGIVVTACVIAGCGSTNEETAEPAVTKAQFVKKAEAVCGKILEEGQDARIAWEKAHGKEMGYEAVFKRIVGPTLKREAEELRSLAAPAADEAKITRMTANLSKGADAFATEGIEPKSTSSFEAFRREAKAYGLGACQI